MEPSLSTILLGSAVVVAVVEAIKEIILWLVNRKAQKHDKHDDQKTILVALTEKIDKISTRLDEYCDKVNNIDLKQDIQCSALQASLGNTIEYLAGKYIERGSITVSELAKLEDLYEPYHACGGNGAKTALLTRCRNLPIQGYTIE